jgi:hypothetical protein
MSANPMFDCTMEIMDKFIDELERNSVRRPRERNDFDDLSEGAQRHAICEHVRTHTYDIGLFGESINEHNDTAKYLAAFKAGDLLEMGRLADRMTREYIGSVIQMEWENKR